MKKLVIFYDDKKKSCCEYAEAFAGQENAECRKASDYPDQKPIYAMDCKIGLIFESERGRVPYSILHVIWRLTATKTEKHMILVTGGQKEFHGIRTAMEEMRQRGYETGSVYSRYLIEKQRMGTEEAVEWMLHELSEGYENLLAKDRYEGLSGRTLRRHLREEIRHYREYKKHQQI